MRNLLLCALALPCALLTPGCDDDVAAGDVDAVVFDARIRRDAAPDATPGDAAQPDMAADALIDATPLDATAPDQGLTCAPGQRVCSDRETVSICNESGTAYVVDEECPSGAGCSGAECVSWCLIGGKAPDYVGCTYWSVDLDNYPDPFGDPSAVPHAIVVSNPSGAQALVTIDTLADLDLGNPQFTVAPGGVRTYTFPRFDIDGTGITDRSFRIQSTWPIVVHQFNPLNNEGVASNDASLLLPAESLGREYMVLSWPTTPIPEQFMLPPQHGYFTVIATSSGMTEVEVIPSALVDAGPGIEAIQPGEIRTFTLQFGEVLNLQADGSNIFALQDLTGSEVTANQPIAVFGGHEEAVVGDGCCAEHLEQQLFPVSTLGTRYLAAPAEDRNGPGDVWRVLAAEDGTTVRTTPAQTPGGLAELDRGEWIEIDTGEPFEILSSAPVIVGQYLRSGQATDDRIGDPAFILAVPVTQFLSEYTLLTPADYDEDWMTVVRMPGTLVQLDGELLPADGFRPIGMGDYEMAWVRVDDGPHLVVGTEPFGLSAYGYSAAVSYGFPAGLNLRRMP
ncbi:MAG: hypothetical protein ACI9U2_001065 [Bradymonadia bacterium]|jgi:hypothetical protein